MIIASADYIGCPSSSSSSSSRSSSSSSSSSSSTSSSSSSTSSSSGITDWKFPDTIEARSATLGKINSGELSNVYTYDDNKLILDENNTTPGFCYYFTFEDIPDPNAAYTMWYKGNYTGSEDHIVKFQILDNDTTSYVDIMTLPTSRFAIDYHRNLPQGSQYVDSTNTMTIRVINFQILLIFMLNQQMVY